MRFITSRKGSTMVIFSLTAVVLLALVSLVLDVGVLTVHKTRLTHAVDSAALAGAQELIYHNYPAQIKAAEYLNKNGYLNDSFNADIIEDGTAIRVTASHRVNFGLAKVMRFSSAIVSSTAKGKVLPVISISEGIRPFAIERHELVFGEQYVLKSGSGSGGNFGGISLGGNGAQVYYNNIINGYNQRLMVGDIIETEPGNMSGPTERGIDRLIDQCTHVPRCTFDNFNPDCPRLITVVIVDNLDVNGRSSVEIVGFASFFLEGVGGSGNASEVTGRFIRTVTNGEVGESQEDFGLYGVRLME